jgi:uncharacterized protein (DUF934 family)
MRRIIHQREIVDDAWIYPAQTAAAAADADKGEDTGVNRAVGGRTRVVLSLADFLAAAKSGQLPSGGAALELQPADEVEQLQGLLDRVTLIVVQFPKFGEGRGYTQAQLLRLRYRYTGELRAAGAVKRDHLFHLARCGFDSFDLDAGENLEGALAAFGSFTVGYQPASDLDVHLRARAL